MPGSAIVLSLPRRSYFFGSVLEPGFLLGVWPLSFVTVTGPSPRFSGTAWFGAAVSADAQATARAVTDEFIQLALTNPSGTVICNSIGSAAGA